MSGPIQYIAFIILCQFWFIVYWIYCLRWFVMVYIFHRKGRDLSEDTYWFLIQVASGPFFILMLIHVEDIFFIIMQHYPFYIYIAIILIYVAFALSFHVIYVWIWMHFVRFLDDENFYMLKALFFLYDEDWIKSDAKFVKFINMCAFWLLFKRRYSYLSSLVIFILVWRWMIIDYL